MTVAEWQCMHYTVTRHAGSQALHVLERQPLELADVGQVFAHQVGQLLPLLLPSLPVTRPALVLWALNDLWCDTPQ